MTGFLLSNGKLEKEQVAFWQKSAGYTQIRMKTGIFWLSAVP
jgi:hypothetical protein